MNNKYFNIYPYPFNQYPYNELDDDDIWYLHTGLNKAERKELINKIYGQNKYFYVKKTYYGNYVKNTFFPLDRIENNIRNKTGIKNTGENETKLLNNRIRTQGNCIRKAIHNFQNADKLTFLTLTYAVNETDIKKCKYDLMKLFQNITRYRKKYKKCKDFKYLYAYEYQNRGAVHFHIILDCYIPNKIIRKYWLYGINKNIKVQKRTNEQLIKYLSKYMVKSLTKNELEKIEVAKEFDIDYKSKNVASGNKLNNLFDLNIKLYQFSRNCDNVATKTGLINMSFDDLWEIFIHHKNGSKKKVEVL
ncbi:rolling circle replication-associated protein [Spiroplasma endosymbiont of Ammophila pubescens]|uniref:rolling circle replication-associated protein n=1 Tax=Spiroplasma endosymbiont of Ammophila pubescens TaxID=3066315 RepID=UPI0032B12246